MTIREGLKKLYAKIIGSEPNGKTVRALVEELADNYTASETDLSDYYTKEETDAAIEAESSNIVYLECESADAGGWEKLMNFSITSQELRAAVDSGKYIICKLKRYSNETPIYLPLTSITSSPQSYYFAGAIVLFKEGFGVEDKMVTAVLTTDGSSFSEYSQVVVSNITTT